MKNKLYLCGLVQNCFSVDERKTREGEIVPARDRVQILAENTLPEGEKRLELVDLTVTGQLPVYKTLIGKEVMVPVGVFVDGKTALFYAVKGERPQLLNAASAPGAAAAA